MSEQPTPIVHVQVCTPRGVETREDQAIYTFTGGLHGAGLQFTFGLFGLVQADPDHAADADHVLREIAHRLLDEIYLPLLPWQSTNRPNPLDSLNDVMSDPMDHIQAAVIAVVLDRFVYISWFGKGRAFSINQEGIEPFVTEDETPVASYSIQPGSSLLLCASEACPDMATGAVYQIVQEAPTLEDACKQLSEDHTGLLMMIQRPDESA